MCRARLVTAKGHSRQFENPVDAKTESFALPLEWSNFFRSDGCHTSVAKCKVPCGVVVEPGPLSKPLRLECAANNQT